MRAITGARPGEVFALRWGDLDLDVGSVHVARSPDHRGGKFVDLKTEGGIRTADLSKLLVAELVAHRERAGEAPAGALVFPTGAGRPARRPVLRTHAAVGDRGHERAGHATRAMKPRLELAVDNDQRDVRQPLDEPAAPSAAVKVRA
jgi:integrase